MEKKEEKEPEKPKPASVPPALPQQGRAGGGGQRGAGAGFAANAPKLGHGGYVGLQRLFRCREPREGPGPGGRGQSGGSNLGCTRHSHGWRSEAF